MIVKDLSKIPETQFNSCRLEHHFQIFEKTAQRSKLWFIFCITLCLATEDGACLKSIITKEYVAYKLI